MKVQRRTTNNETECGL